MKQMRVSEIIRPALRGRTGAPGTAPMIAAPAHPHRPGRHRPPGLLGGVRGRTRPAPTGHALGAAPSTGTGTHHGATPGAGAAHRRRCYFRAYFWAAFSGR
jgi:hypothetical protein